MTDSNESASPIESAIDLVGRPAQLRGQTVYAGIDLGIVDMVAEGPKSVSDITAELGLPGEYTSRLLRALDVYGVLDEDDEGRFSLTPVGERFQSDHPESIRDLLMFFYNPTRFAAVRHLPKIVTAGDPTGYELEYDKSMFEMFEEDQEFSEQFNGMQDLSSLGETEQILDSLAAVDFSQFSTVCDVGGGYGDLVCNLLAQYPDLEGSVLELPSVLAEEEHLWAAKLGVEERCTYVAGDMFEEVPEADAYILKAILHDWSDEDCVQILRNVHEAAPEAARLFVRERIVSETDPDPATIDMDVWMMLETGGKERTQAEFEALFERAGWTLDDILAVEDDLAILDCRKQ